MTVQTTTSRVTYLGNGVTVNFAISFRFLQDTDIKAVVQPADPLSPPVTLVLNTDYTVTGARAVNGGTLTTTSPVANGATIIIDRGNMVATQLIDYRANDPFPEESAEDGLDKLTMLVLQLMGVNSRTFRLGDAVVANISTIMPQSDPGKPLVWAGDGLSIVNGDLSAGDLLLRPDLAASSAGNGLDLIGYPPTTNQHFTQNGAKVRKFNDRVFVGGATKNDGAFPNTEKDWMAEYWIAGGFSSGPSVSAVLSVMNNTAANSAIPILGAVQSKNFTSAGTAGLGVFGCAFNDNATLATKVWGGYFEAHRTTAGTADTYGIEIDVRTLVDSVAPNPFQLSDIVGLQVACGAEWSAGPQFDAGAGIYVASNPKKFKSGLVFGATAITGTDGVTGVGEAIALAKGHYLRWYASGGVGTGLLYSSAAVANTAPGVELADGQVSITSAVNGALQHAFGIDKDAVNRLEYYPSATGLPLRILAGGSDANIDLRFVPKGAGVLRFGTFTANADAPITGYISIKDDAGNVRKLATIA